MPLYIWNSSAIYWDLKTHNPLSFFGFQIRSRIKTQAGNELCLHWFSSIAIHCLSGWFAEKVALLPSFVWDGMINNLTVEATNLHDIFYRDFSSVLSFLLWNDEYFGRLENIQEMLSKFLFLFLLLDLKILRCFNNEKKTTQFNSFSSHIKRRETHYLINTWIWK